MHQDFKDKPELLSFYLPSTQELLHGLSDHLNELIKEKTGEIDEFSIDDLDIW